jgi:hypothetical protein
MSGGSVHVRWLAQPHGVEVQSPMRKSRTWDTDLLTGFEASPSESATNTRVVLVINNNIYLIDLIFIASKFQKRSMIVMARTYGCGPLKMSRTRLATPRLFIFHFSDPRSH